MSVGVSVHEDVLVPDPNQRVAVLRAAASAGCDHVSLGDHVSFHGGTGFDGLIGATAVLASHPTLPVLVGIYQLALRHPLLVSRQLADLARIAPGRLTLGVGVAGEDRSEVSNSGVDPRTRGRRLDESLDVLAALSTGDAVDHTGEFFTLDGARVLPAPDPPVPVVIGGAGNPAVRRTARTGDGWLGLFCTARRYAVTRTQIIDTAAEVGRAPAWWGLSIWCGFGDDARGLVGERMHQLYRVPPERFAHLVPAGTPTDVADFLSAYVEAGARHLTLIPAAASPEAGIDAVGEVRERLLARHGEAG